MAEYLVERSKRRRTLRKKNNGTPPRSERGVDITQADHIIIDVLQHVQAYNRIHASTEGLKVVWVREIAPGRVDIAAIANQLVQVHQILGIDVSDYVFACIRTKQTRQVTDSRSDFENVVSYERRHHIRHPAIKASSVLH